MNLTPERTWNGATTLVSPELVHRLEPISLRARLVVEGFLTGLHRSPYHGFSVEFAEHRMYQPGDPLRHVDWKVVGRTDRYYIKQYQEETNLRAMVVLDVSGSMGFKGGGTVTKAEYSRTVAAALIHLLLTQRDAVGLAPFDTAPREIMQPRSAMTWRDELFAALVRNEPGGETSLGEALHRVAERLGRRGLVILISDLLDDPEPLLEGLHHFRHNGHEVLALQVLDPREVDFAFDRESKFVELESGKSLSANPWQVGNEYRSEMHRFLETLRDGCARHHVQHHLLTTDTPVEQALLALLIARQRIR
ncbi:MAG: DUF58 domain-containing protein [bacterium]